MKRLRLGFLLVLIVTSVSITQAKAQNIKPNQALADSVRFRLPRKSPTGALFRSLFVPGWGQLYNQRHFKSAVVFLGEGTVIGLMVYEWSQANKFKRDFLAETDPYLKNLDFLNFQLHVDNKNTYLWILAGVTFISMWDAYVDAQFYNFKQETKRLDMMGGVDQEGRVRVGLTLQF